MSVVKFDSLPDSARIWIYGINVPLTAQQQQLLAQHMDAFLPQWTAHKRELQTAWTLKYKQFLFIGVDESQMQASGCSIDALVRHLSYLEQELGVQILDSPTKVFYRDATDTIRCVSRAQFKQLAEQGEVRADSVVFNNVLQAAGDVRAGRWEVPMRESWHGKAFAVREIAT